jgi:hypothetical protein
VVRGGSWNNNQHNARASVRNDNHPDNRNNNIGFRVVCVSHIEGGFGFAAAAVASRHASADRKCQATTVARPRTRPLDGAGWSCLYGTRHCSRCGARRAHTS